MNFFSVTPEDDGRRWWIVRGEWVAVSLTAVPLPDGMGIFSAIRDREGIALMPDCFTAHKSGDLPCPALPGGCDHQGEAISGARQTLQAWAAAGHDDSVIRAALEDIWAREVLAS